ncbi:MAG: helix-turn-helix domain-containing protein [Sphingomonadales bacterium]|nr:helix-turn-helix domain-containing protein [Sphingomonadales bacterium]
MADHRVGERSAIFCRRYTENLHRLDLTKEQRDGHIRRYAELLEARAAIVPQNAEQIEVKRGRPVGTVTKIAQATGLSKSTVRRALNPKPHVREYPPVQDRKEHSPCLARFRQSTNCGAF